MGIDWGSKLGRSPREEGSRLPPVKNWLAHDKWSVSLPLEQSQALSHRPPHRAEQRTMRETGGSHPPVPSRRSARNTQTHVYTGESSRSSTVRPPFLCLHRSKPRQRTGEANGLLGDASISGNTNSNTAAGQQQEAASGSLRGLLSRGSSSRKSASRSHARGVPQGSSSGNGLGPLDSPVLGGGGVGGPSSSCGGEGWYDCMWRRFHDGGVIGGGTTRGGPLGPLHAGDDGLVLDANDYTEKAWEAMGALGAIADKYESAYVEAEMLLLGWA
ncbi:hypothetical protein ACSSS7_007212 [Eimeria intestinalis]